MDDGTQIMAGTVARPCCSTSAASSASSTKPQTLRSGLMLKNSTGNCLPDWWATVAARPPKPAAAQVAQSLVFRC